MKLTTSLFLSATAYGKQQKKERATTNFQKSFPRVMNRSLSRLKAVEILARLGHQTRATKFSMVLMLRIPGHGLFDSVIDLKQIQMESFSFVGEL